MVFSTVGMLTRVGPRNVSIHVAAVYKPKQTTGVWLNRFASARVGVGICTWAGLINAPLRHPFAEHQLTVTQNTYRMECILANTYRDYICSKTRRKYTRNMNCGKPSNHSSILVCSHIPPATNTNINTLQVQAVIVSEALDAESNF